MLGEMSFGCKPLFYQEGMLSGLLALVAKSNDRASAVKAALGDKSLPEDLIGALRNRTGDTTSCVQLFICKMAPVIWGVQVRVSTVLTKINPEKNLSSSRPASNLSPWTLPGVLALMDIVGTTAFGIRFLTEAP